MMNERAPFRRRLSRALACATLVAGLAACASSSSGPQSGNPFGQSEAERSQIRIHVRNFNFSDATVWTIVRDGRRDRLGIVTGKSDATFTVEWKFSEPLRLEFDLLASVRCITEEIPVDPGDVLELQISVDPSSDPTCR